MNRLPEPKPLWIHDPLRSGQVALAVEAGIALCAAVNLAGQWLANPDPLYRAMLRVMIPFVATIVGVCLLAVGGMVAGLSLRRKRQLDAARPRAPEPGGTPLLRFQDADNPRQVYPLTTEDLRRLLFVSGRPGTGKSTTLAGLADGYMRRAPGGAPVNLVVFDPHRDLARRIAWLSRRYGRRTVVVDLGHPDWVTSLTFPRPTLAGAAAAADSFCEGYFPFEREVPSQLRNTLGHTFYLLGAAGYSFDQSLRLLLSPAFRRHLLQRGGAALSTHVRAWVSELDQWSPGDRYRTLDSSLARLHTLLGLEPVRLLLGGRGGFSLDEVTAPAADGRGVDLILTASGGISYTTLWFVYGLWLAELGAVLRGCLTRPADPGRPALALFLDETGKYGAAGAFLDLITSLRNVQVSAVCAAHSLTSLLDPRLQDQVSVIGVNRLAGAETGPGAELAARQLAPYRPEAVSLLSADGRPAAHWSPAAQLQKFQHDLETAPDYVFALRPASTRQTRWVRPIVEPGLFPAESELEAALAQAARASGRPTAEVRADLDREHAALDRQFGGIAYPLDAEPGNARWQDRPDDDFAPW